MKKIEIEWLDDETDCETCGRSYATGAKVFLDGELLLELDPIAACFDGMDWSTNEVYELILEKIGYSVNDL